MSDCYLIDIDGVLNQLHSQPPTPIPGAIEAANALFDAGHQVWIFTCWAPTQESRDLLQSWGLKFHGMIHKPYTEGKYVFIDDNLDVTRCATELVFFDADTYRREAAEKKLQEDCTHGIIEDQGNVGTFCVLCDKEFASEEEGERESDLRMDHSQVNKLPIVVEALPDPFESTKMYRTPLVPGWSVWL